MRVTFTADVLHETIGRGQGQRYEAGSTHDLRDDYAQKWISKGVAVLTVDEPVVVAEPPAPEPVVVAEPAAWEQKIVEDDNPLRRVQRPARR